jgi:sec-independent protein translocase protein TatB
VNANLTLSEILTISVIILIVFGPHRLPELARKAGLAVAKLRQAAGNVRQELTAGTEELAKPLADIDRDLRAAKADLKAAIPNLDDIAPTRKPRQGTPTSGVEPAVDRPGDEPPGAADPPLTGNPPPPP